MCRGREEMPGREGNVLARRRQCVGAAKKCPGAEKPQILCHPALYRINKIKTPWHKGTAGLLFSQIWIKHQTSPGVPGRGQPVKAGAVRSLSIWRSAN